MGHIYEDHGTISIEGHRQSFTIHAGYGYTPGRFPLKDFAALGEEFVAPMRDVELVDARRTWRVSLIAEDRIEAREDVSSVIQTFAPDEVVERPGFEQDVEGTFAERWREWHPEFADEDLDDLIDALTDYRAKRRDR